MLIDYLDVFWRSVFTVRIRRMGEGNVFSLSTTGIQSPSHNISNHWSWRTLRSSSSRPQYTRPLLGHSRHLIDKHQPAKTCTSVRQWTRLPRSHTSMSLRPLDRFHVLSRGYLSVWSHVSSWGYPWDCGRYPSTPLSGQDWGTPLRQVTLWTVPLRQFPAGGLSCWCSLWPRLRKTFIAKNMWLPKRTLI